MKILLDGVITNLLNQPMKEPDGAAVTLRNILIGALLNAEDQNRLDVVAKQRRFAQALRFQLHKENTIDLTAEEIAELKKLVCPLFNTLVSGRAFELLEKAVSEDQPPSA